MDRAALRTTLIELIEADTGTRHDALDDGTNLRDGLGLDSVDVVSVVSQVERRFKIRMTHEELERLVTVGDFLDLVLHKLADVPAPRVA